jgi:hypothetical protein
LPLMKRADPPMLAEVPMAALPLYGS